MERKIIQVEERPPLALNIPLSIQHLFAMFGSTVLVPFLFNVSPTTCLFMNGIGTLLYLFITKGRIPSYLGSSFAFISPVLAIMATSSYHDAQSGFIVFGIIFILFSALIKATGTGWIDVIFPPACMGAIIAVIGLELAPTAASMAGLRAKTLIPTTLLFLCLPFALPLSVPSLSADFLPLYRYCSALSVATFWRCSWALLI